MDDDHSDDDYTLNNITMITQHWAHNKGMGNFIVNEPLHKKQCSLFKRFHMKLDMVAAE